MKPWLPIGLCVIFASLIFSCSKDELVQQAVDTEKEIPVRGEDIPPPPISTRTITKEAAQPAPADLDADLNIPLYLPAPEDGSFLLPRDFYIDELEMPPTADGSPSNIVAVWLKGFLNNNINSPLQVATVASLLLDIQKDFESYNFTSFRISKPYAFSPERKSFLVHMRGAEKSLTAEILLNLYEDKWLISDFIVDKIIDLSSEEAFFDPLNYKKFFTY